VERQFVSLRIDPPAQPLGHGGDGRGHTPDHRLGVERADPRGASICRMFNQIIAGQSLPRHLSSDHDPLFRFPSLARQLAHTRGRGDQVDPVCTGVPSVRGTADRDNTTGVS
jgi:hypothetical protein